MKNKNVKRFLGRMLLVGLMISYAAFTYAESRPLFQYNDKVYQASDFSNQLKVFFYQVESQYYEQQNKVADLALFELHLDAEANRRNKSVEDIRKELLAVNEPDDAMVESFYERNKARINAPLDQVRPKIVQFLINTQIEQKRAAIIAKLKKGGEFKLLLTEPLSPKLDIATDGYPFKGDPDAPVTLVEFADYQCPRCREMSVELKKLMKEYGDKVKLVYRDFPINDSGISRRVAEGAVCADQQGKFWEYHDIAFEMQPGLNNDSPMDFADILGLDKMAFTGCLDSTETKAKVDASKVEGDQLRIIATPTIFINGRFTSERNNKVDLRTEIEKAISATEKK